MALVVDQQPMVGEMGDIWIVTDTPPNVPIHKINMGVAWNVSLSEGAAILFEDTGGNVQEGRFSAADGSLILEEGFKWEATTNIYHTYLKLTNKNPLTFRFIADTLIVPELPSETIEDGVHITFQNDLSLLNQPSVPWDLFQLSRQAALFASTPDFEKLISLSLLRDVELYDHQIKTVKTVLRNFRGRGLLCDEVGLGKTVEAGLILLELFVRKLVRRVLILTPPSLVSQWQGEMQRKFGMPFVTYDDPDFKKDKHLAWEQHEKILVSYHTAKLEPYCSWIARQHWDMVIIDEAHHLRNQKTKLWKFASTLQKKYILLLTATPMQNSLEDLFSLVTLLKPGLLNTEKQFKKRFVDKKNNFNVKNIDQLRTLIRECMIRNRRATISINFTKRFAQTLRITPHPEEQEFYQEVTAFVKTQLQDGKPALPKVSLLSLQRLMGSSLQAAFPLLQQLIDKKRLPADDAKTLMTLVNRTKGKLASTKALRLLTLVEKFKDKMVIFTQFRATQDFLYQTLKEAGHSVAVFHGSLTRMQKEEAIQQFQGNKQLLISTDSGSEGRNLQFCHAICNFDLPWNPMRIEQRIGRVSRLGQARDVHIFNLVNADTIEDEVLRLLELKVNLFEQVIGEMDMIVGNLEEDREFEDVVIDLWIESNSRQEFVTKMEAFGDRLLDAKTEYLEQQKREDEIFGDNFTAKD